MAHIFRRSWVDLTLAILQSARSWCSQRSKLICVFVSISLIGVSDIGGVGGLGGIGDVEVEV